MRDEARPGLLIIMPVAQGQPDSPDVELPRHPYRAWLQQLIEHVKGLIGQGFAVGDAFPGRINRSDGIEDGPDRCLGGAAQTHYLHIIPQRFNPVR